jgi:hypothetical protein
VVTQQALKRGSHTSIPQLRAAILAYVDAHKHEAPLPRGESADDILDRMRRICLRVQQVHAQ